MSDQLTICKRCVMDTTDSDIIFDKQGFCNHCTHTLEELKSLKENFGNNSQKLHNIVSVIKQKCKNNRYDCIIGLSGGVDSSYIAFLVKKLGLRPLAIHFDSGWNSELAVKNIENIVRKLDIDLITYVMDWDEMRDLQLAYFKASVLNCDIPQDHAIVTAIYDTANSKGIKFLITGSNLATESILPKSWTYSSRDPINLKAIHNKYGTIKLIKYPLFSLWKNLYYKKVKKIVNINLLDFINYNKAEAIKIIEGELGWRNYGGKHYESVFTRFFQGYYLPVKFNIDKRKAHLSSLICSGQITRDEALEELKKDTYPELLMKSDKEFVAKKIGVTLDDFNKIIALPPRSHKEFPGIGKFLNLAHKYKINYSGVIR